VADIIPTQGGQLLSEKELIAAALVGMPFPGRCWQLIAWADYNAAPQTTRDLLRRLPEDTVYPNLGHVVAQAEGLTTRAAKL
jgi:hypothetical protein